MWNFSLFVGSKIKKISMISTRERADYVCRTSECSALSLFTNLGRLRLTLCNLNGYISLILETRGGLSQLKLSHDTN